MLRKVKILYWPYYLLAFLLGAHVCTAQFTDNFSDGDFTSNPVWNGSNADFTINATNQLQLNNTVASTSRLSSSFVAGTLNNFEWQIYVKQTFAPSASNYGRVYLASDQSDLTSSLNGYYLQFGEAGSLDAIELFRQTGLTSVSVCRGTNGLLAASFTVRIRVLRNSAGLWQIFTDHSGGTNFTLETSGTDATYNSSSALGVVCVYTSGNADNFFYDDFYMGPEIVDTTPPTIGSVTATSSTALTVVFNEKVESASAQSTSNYTVNNGVGQPMIALLQPDEKTVHLTFTQTFPNATTSQLTVTGVKDLFNNAIATANQNFFFFQSVAAVKKDIIITEIFADPSPVVGLPEVEFVEIHNRSNKIFDLLNWKLTDGSSAGTLPTHLIHPNEYVIITTTASVAQFSSFGTVLGVANFPTLNNSSDALVLKDNTDASIDAVQYSDSWYRDDDKKQGGYTLELIDLANPCGEDDNWVASESTTGGTPGTQNSVFANKPDLTGPKLLTAIPTSLNTLVLQFDEKLSEALPATQDFVFTPTLTASQVSFTDASLKSYQLTLSNNLISGTVYSIIAQSISDCNGNEIQSDFDSVVFGLPEEADSRDVLINEILFNPRPTGVDFVEVYNNSSKFINLKNWVVANYEDGILLNSKVITTSDFLIAPNRYIVFTEDKDILIGEYASSIEENIFEVADLPSFNDDEGTVALVDANENIIDFFSYLDNYHSVFIDDDEGVSLERISFTAATLDQSNWKSASSSSGYATPGFVNSNVRGEHVTGKITVSPEAFEPVTGQPSFTQIHYSFDQGGFVANVKILDFQGREIKELVNNATLGTEGFFRWDGDTKDGSKARIGYYVVWVEVYSASGQVDTFRKRVVVAARN